MPQIFNNPYKNIDTWSAQGAIVMWWTGNGDAPTTNTQTDKGGALPLYMTDIRMTYGRNQQSYYPIGADPSGDSTKVIINGAPSGRLDVTGIYSPTAQTLSKFIEAVSKECKSTANGDNVNISIRPFGKLKCSSAGAERAIDGSANHGELQLKGLELATIGLNIQGGEVAIVSLPLVFTFTGLDWKF